MAKNIYKETEVDSVRNTHPGNVCLSVFVEENGSVTPGDDGHPLRLRGPRSWFLKKQSVVARSW